MCAVEIEKAGMDGMVFRAKERDRLVRGTTKTTNHSKQTIKEKRTKKREENSETQCYSSPDTRVISSK
jgi:hypothetical protein